MEQLISMQNLIFFCMLNFLILTWDLQQKKIQMYFSSDSSIILKAHN
jgi:hypothetical protein